MSKQILILNGSPRIHGNTAALIDAFTAGAEAAGHTITRFDLAALDIHGCRGCLGGGKDPRHPCVQRDGMDAVYPAYMAADVVVLASPMYYWSISGQLKCAFDRLFAVAELGPDLANPVKDAVFFLWRAAGSPDMEGEFPFADVPFGDGDGHGQPLYRYADQAVLWAVENVVASGTTETTFSPGTPCTRGQIATFLYRAAQAETSAK